MFDVVNAPDAEVNVAVTQGTFSIGSSAIDNITSQLTGSGLVNIDPAATLHADINLQNNLPARMHILGLAKSTPQAR
ncbi:hypothetical protein [Enterobacter cloacae complex sp.6730764]|uniref:hypothetical protein n=1 Tax=Enterobacter cloacae complex sp.6730764 TaxID=3397166 RepID=UPI002076566F|nr:hypothetical protein [Enterobacter hormaechei]